MVPLLEALHLGDEGRLRTRFLQGYKPACSQFPQVQGQDIGWIQVSDVPTGLHLDQLHLIPSWRGRGIGGRLVISLLVRARATRSAVTLDVIRGNPAIRLYQRLGFSIVAADIEKFQMLWRPSR